ncbi:PAS domain S-box protein [Bacillus sp. AK128]
MSSSNTINHDEKRVLLQQHIEEILPKYEKLYNSNMDALFILDLQGFFVKANTAFQELSGYTEEELTRLTYNQLLSKDDQNEIELYFSRSIKGEFKNFDCSFIKKSGGNINLNISNIPLCRNSEMVGIAWAVKDVTHFKRQREKYKRDQEIFQIVTEHSLDIIIRATTNGEILYISPACEKILNYTASELVGKNISTLIHNYDANRVEKFRDDILKQRKNSRELFKMLNKHQGYVWVEALCKPILSETTSEVTEVVCTIRDISEQKKAELELKGREETYRNLVEYSPDAVMVVRGNEILFINDTGMKLLGAQSKEEIYQRKISDFVHSDYIELAFRRINIVKSGSATQFTEYKLFRLDGSTVEVEIMGIPTIFENQPANHVIIRSVEEKRKTQELILHSEKLATAGKLAAGIAHEVRNPLTAIKGFHQLMQSESDTNKKYYEIINAEIDRIELILNELLVLSKPQELKVANIELIRLVEDIKTLIETEANMKGIQIRTHYDYKKLALKADKNQLKQVFINILKNSIEALEKNGEITLEVRSHGTSKIKLLFKDNGCGIPEHLLKRIGEPFFTTKENGTGLGIMISKQIIENHNGNFYIWSDPKGTIIEIILPVTI